MKIWVLHIEYEDTIYAAFKDPNDAPAWIAKQDEMNIPTTPLKEGTIRPSKYEGFLSIVDGDGEITAWELTEVELI